MSKRPPVSKETSPWHDGERLVRRRVGVEGEMETIGSRAIVDFLVPRHRAFWASLPCGLLGTVDEAGAAWVTALAGLPGFIAAPDSRHLHVAGQPPAEDPATAGWIVGGSVGLLGIDLPTRQRIRANGMLSAISASGATLDVQQAFGNCPQYIQARDVRWSNDPRRRVTPPGSRRQGLDDPARQLISRADTFFVSSYLEARDGAERAVDVSHRGGRPGFVRVDGDRLSIPDFAGNRYFNTLGNFVQNPRAGLLFVDFASGDLLHVTGDVALDFDGTEVRAFPGAERVWHVAVRESLLRRGALPLQFGPADQSPNVRDTGTWARARLRAAADERRDPWRPYRVRQVVRESTVIRSFLLEPADGLALPAALPGQHIPVRLTLPLPWGIQERLYSLSGGPADGLLRISVKRQGRVSSFLHDQVREGSEVAVRAARGGFTLNQAEERPLILASAGVGITPMVAMLRHLIQEGRGGGRLRPTWFLHAAHDGMSRPFDAEVAELVRLGGRAITHIRFLSAPGDGDVAGIHFDVKGQLDPAALCTLAPVLSGDVFLCGPPGFMQASYDSLRRLGVPDDRIHAESFGPAGLMRDSQDAVGRLPPSATPIPVSFVRSGKTFAWTPGDRSLLELADSNGLALAASCRSGRCGTCRVPLAQGQVTYSTAPSAGVTAHTALLCQAVPAEGSAPLILNA